MDTEKIIPILERSDLSWCILYTGIKGIIHACEKERWTYRNHLDGSNSFKDEPEEIHTDFFFFARLLAEEKPSASNLTLP